MDEIIKFIHRRNDAVGLLDERHLFTLGTKSTDISVLFDTGAQDCVWCKPKKLLEKCFGKINEKPCYAIVTRFGKLDTTKYPVYSIPEFKIGDLTIVNLPVILHPMHSHIHLIL